MDDIIIQQTDARERRKDQMSCVFLRQRRFSRGEVGGEGVVIMNWAWGNYLRCWKGARAMTHEDEGERDDRKRTTC